MKKILIAGAGGAPSEGVIKSLKMSEHNEVILGMGADESDLEASLADLKYKVPYCNEEEYEDTLRRLLIVERPDFLHVQNDLELYVVSQFREWIKDLGVAIYMPDHQTIDTCVHKYKSYLAFQEAGIPVPQNMVISSERDVDEAFSRLANQEEKIWLRDGSIGGGGKGSLSTSNSEFAKHWIDHHDGWGKFLAAEQLTNRSVTWLSIWFEGELVVAQSRLRRGWTHGNRTVSGVTGVTKVGETISDQVVNDTAAASVWAVDEKPHGIFGVDLCYHPDGTPMPTEINIGRFFTTVLFFSQAGLNMPEIYKNIALYGEFPSLQRKMNPLSPGMLWIRGMDREPLLRTTDDFGQGFSKL